MTLVAAGVMCPIGISRDSFEAGKQEPDEFEAFFVHIKHKVPPARVEHATTGLDISCPSATFVSICVIINKREWI